MFEKLKNSMFSVSKTKSTKPLAWVDDLVMQTRLARKEGISGPLSISFEEVDDLVRYRAIVLAAEEFWEFHKKDVDWMSDSHSTKFFAVMRDLYDRDRGN